MWKKATLTYQVASLFHKISGCRFPMWEPSTSESSPPPNHAFSTAHRSQRCRFRHLIQEKDFPVALFPTCNEHEVK